jgi:hypothetical protein
MFYWLWSTIWLARHDRLSLWHANKDHAKNQLLCRRRKNVFLNHLSTPEFWWPVHLVTQDGCYRCLIVKDIHDILQVGDSKQASNPLPWKDTWRSLMIYKIFQLVTFQLFNRVSPLHSYLFYHQFIHIEKSNMSCKYTIN